MKLQVGIKFQSHRPADDERREFAAGVTTPHVDVSGGVDGRMGPDFGKLGMVLHHRRNQSARGTELADDMAAVEILRSRVGGKKAGRFVGDHEGISGTIPSETDGGRFESGWL